MPSAWLLLAQAQQIRTACGSAYPCGNAAAMPALGVEPLGADTPQLARHLRGNEEALQQQPPGTAGLFAYRQQCRQHRHGGVSQIGGGRVIQLQLMAGDSVDKGGIPAA